MKIAFDSKRACCNASGLGTYSRNLLNGLNKFYPTNDYVLFTPFTKNHFHQTLAANQQLFLPNQYSTKIQKNFWRIYSIYNDVNNSKANIYHGLSNELPFSAKKINAKKVVTIHDVIFEKYKQQYSFFDRNIYHTKTKFACNHADTIIACSQETKNDLIQFYKIKEEKIKVIYQSCHPVFFKELEEQQRLEVLLKYAILQPYILHIGSFNSRKNQLNLIDAYSQIANKIKENLVLIGNEGNMLPALQRQIEKHNLANRIKIINGVANENLPAIYQAAAAFAFPSFFEGFGIPVLEALASKTPVITTKGGCFEEVGGKDSLYCNPNSPQEIATAILAVINNASLQNTMKTNGYEHAQKFSEENFIRNTMEVYTNL